MTFDVKKWFKVSITFWLGVFHIFMCALAVFLGRSLARLELFIRRLKGDGNNA